MRDVVTFRHMATVEPTGLVQSVHVHRDHINIVIEHSLGYLVQSKVSFMRFGQGDWLIELTDKQGPCENRSEVPSEWRASVQQHDRTHQTRPKTGRATECIDSFNKIMTITISKLKESKDKSNNDDTFVEMLFRVVSLVSHGNAHIVCNAVRTRDGCYVRVLPPIMAGLDE